MGKPNPFRLKIKRKNLSIQKKKIMDPHKKENQATINMQSFSMTEI
jgi:hypothetical protein